MAKTGSAQAVDDEDRSSDGKFHHGCGESFQHAAWYSKHALKCDGKPVQKRGRIERLAGRRGEKPARPVTTRVAPAPEEKPTLTAVMAKADPSYRSLTVVPPIAPDAGRDELLTARDLLLVELRRKRDIIDNAIAGLETLG